MAILPLPPSGVAFIDPITGGVSVQWQNYLLSLTTISGGFAPLDAEYWVSTSNSDLTNETNLGALTTGYMKLTVAAGVGTPSTVTTIPGGDVTGAALSTVNDTNVTLTASGTPLTALLKAVTLTMAWTGQLSVARGGTGAATLTTHGVLLGQGTSAVTATAVGATGTVLHGNTGADPTYSAVSLTADVTGTLPVVNGGTGDATLAAHGVLVGNGTSAVSVTGTGSAGQVLTSNGAAADPTFQASAAVVDNGIVDFRLTLTTAVPVTTADVTGATTIYCAPYTGNRIALYDGSNWNTRTSAEFSLAVGTLTAALPYDVFCYDNATVPTLEFLAWTSTTARATALTTQDGVLSKTGALTRRYMGTFYTTATTTTEDSLAKRYLWNYYNRVPRPLQRLETTASWNYTTATIRQANGSSANQVALVLGVAEVPVNLTLSTLTSQTNASVFVQSGIGVDSTTTISSQGGAASSAVAGGFFTLTSTYEAFPAVGSHFYSWNEYSGAGTGTTTWYDNSGVSGNFGLTGWIAG